MGRSFSYKAISNDGQPVSGVEAADDEATLSQALRTRGLFLLESKETGAAVGRAVQRGGRVGAKELMSFTYQLSVAIDAGIPAVRAIETFSESSSSERMKATLVDVAGSVREGRSFAEALSRHPAVFSNIYVALVAAGERSGKLDTVLRDLVTDLEWREEMRSQARQATVYPLVLLSALVLLVVFLLGFVLPRFFAIFEEAQIPLPGPTLALITASDLLRGYWWLEILLVIGAAVTLKLVFSNPASALEAEKILMRLPLLGDLRKKIALARFSRAFSLMLFAGVGVPEALRLLEGVVGNAFLAREISAARRRIVDEGSRITDAFARSGAFPPLILQMLDVGETAGRLDDSLGKVATYYGKEVPASVKRLISILEPVMLVSVALVIAVVVLAVYLPIFQISNIVDIPTQ